MQKAALSEKILESKTKNHFVQESYWIFTLSKGFDRRKQKLYFGFTSQKTMNYWENNQRSSKRTVFRTFEKLLVSWHYLFEGMADCWLLFFNLSMIKEECLSWFLGWILSSLRKRKSLPVLLPENIRAHLQLSVKAWILYKAPQWNARYPNSCPERIKL